MGLEEIFGEPIHSYSRKQAIEDGVLVDVSAMAGESGFKYPVALTAAVYGEYVKVPEGVTGQDEKGRLWDILQKMFWAIVHAPNSDTLLFGLHVRKDNSDGPGKIVKLKSVCGPDDDGSPCITIMMPEED